MVKSVLGVNHQGLSDWLIQRISAVVMAIYIIGLVMFFVTHSDMTYYQWHHLFAQLWMRVATIVVFLLLSYHAWIGMWTIFTDYVTSNVIRFILDTVTILALIAFFFAAVLIVWGV